MEELHIKSVEGAPAEVAPAESSSHQKKIESSLRKQVICI